MAFFSCAANIMDWFLQAEVVFYSFSSWHPVFNVFESTSLIDALKTGKARDEFLIAITVLVDLHGYEEERPLLKQSTLCAFMYGLL